MTKEIQFCIGSSVVMTVSVINLVLSVLCIFLSWHSGCVISLFAMSVLTLLTVGQGVFLAAVCPLEAPSCRVLYDFFSGGGVAVSGIILLIGFVFVILISLSLTREFKGFRRNREKISFAFVPIRSQILQLLLFIFLWLWLTRTVGGLSLMLSTTRPTAVAGASAAMVAMMALRWTMLKMLVRGIVPVGTYLIIFVMPLLVFTVGGSRVLLLHYLLPVLIAFFIGTGFRLTMPRVGLLLFLGFLVVFGVQAFKLNNGTGVSLASGIHQTFLEFYTTNVEAFSGIVPSVERLFGSLENRTLDFGAPVAAGLQNIIPSGLRPAWLKELAMAVGSVSGETVSVVPPGPAQAFMGFGLVATLAIPTWYLILTQIDRICLTLPPSESVVRWIILGSYLIIWPRGSTQALLVFLTADLLVGSFMQFTESFLQKISNLFGAVGKERTESPL
jgi:hypothetical protein